jgi:Ala-tRNA(Pro) deacylase
LRKAAKIEEGAMPTTVSLHDFLRAARVPHTVVPHRPAFTAQEVAAATHVPGRDWAKVVVCVVDDKPIEAVLPARFLVNLERLLELTGGGDIRLAEDADGPPLFPACEPAVTPPIDPLYGNAVFVDVTLAAEPEIVFNAGTQTEAVAMRWADFARSVRPIVGRFGEAPHDRLNGFKLSYRE